MRLGVFGGTFDPPHLGHLILAERALDTLSLARVLFVPAADPPHKRDRGVTPAVHRVAMLEHAIAGNARFGLSRLDVDRPGPHFTADMLARMQAEFPDAALHFLMGSDSLADLLRWRDPARIIAQARLGVMTRRGAPVDLDALDARLPGVQARTDVFAAPLIDLSATDLREEVRAGRSIRYLVPDAVLAYIAQHGLYQA